MWTKFSALAGSVTGKVLIGTTMAATAAGAQVAGVVDLPGTTSDPAPVIADAAADDSTTSTTTNSTSTTVAPAPPTVPAPTSVTVPVLDAGTAVIDVDGLDVAVVSTQPSAGWRSEVELGDPREAQVNFRNGTARVDLRAEIEDGDLRIRIRDRRTDELTEWFVDLPTAPPATVPTTAAPSTTAPSTTVPSTTVPTTTVTSTTVPGPSGETSTHTVLDAGSVTVAVDGTAVSVVSAQPNAGWTIEIERDEPHEAEVNFRNGPARVDFRAEIEDGRLRIRVRDRRLEDDRSDNDRSGDDRSGDDRSDDDRSGDDHSGSDHDREDDDRADDRSGRDDHEDDDRDEDRSGSNRDDDRDEDRNDD